LLKRLDLWSLSLATLAGCQTFCARRRRNFWRGAVLFPLLFLFTDCGRAAEPALSETNLIPENLSLWTEAMLWDEQASLSSGLGYNNNVLLSAFKPQGSAFNINGLDLMAIRVPLDGWRIVGSLIGDDIRYWRDVGTSREDTFVGSLRVERDLPDGWRAGLEARGLYENQVLQVTSSGGTPTNALVEGYGITVQPSVRKDFADGLWLKLEVPATRWLFQEPLDNYWEFGPVVTAGHDFSPRADVTLSYGASYQDHDEWRTVDKYGRPLPQLLEIFQDRAELAWHQYWDVNRCWRSSTRLVFSYQQDNGGGYFNYYQYQAVEDLRWQTADWNIQASGQIAFQDYPVQTIEPHNSQTLYRNLLNLSLDGERRLFKGLKTFARLEYQQALSNQGGNAGNYNATTVSGGLRYEF
jgi:hypothetical protein